MSRPLALSEDCVGRLRAATLHDRELGGTLTPKTTKDGECVLVCEIHSLVHGSGMEAGTEESRMYSVDGRTDEVLLASTPFYKEVFRVSPVCEWENERCNVYFHTHPLMMLKDQRASLIPPSIGDMIAHGVLGNLRNFKENGILNTTFVAAFEGIYMYNITKAGFQRMRKWIAWIEEQYPEEVAVQNTDDPKELAEPVYEYVMETLSDQLKGPYAEFSTMMEAFCDHHASEFSIKGANKLGDSLWSCKRRACHPDYDFPYARALENPEFRSKIAYLLRHNPYADALRDMGFYYDWDPWKNRMEIAVVTNSNS